MTSEFDDDFLIFTSPTPIKAHGSTGRVTGSFITFGSPAEADADGDFFTAETKLTLAGRLPSRMPLLAEHWLKGGTRGKVYGEADIRPSARGYDLEFHFDLDDPDHVTAYREVKAGKAYLSSGSAAHLVRRERQSNGTNKLLSWPLIEVSVVDHNAADRRNRLIAVKSLYGDGVGSASLVDDLDSLGSRAIELTDVLTRQSVLRRDDGRNPISPARLAAIKSARDGLDKLLTAGTPADPVRVQKLMERAAKLKLGS